MIIGRGAEDHPPGPRPRRRQHQAIRHHHHRPRLHHGRDHQPLRNRWSIEVVFSDAKNITGVGEAHNRTPDAVRRTVPFGLIAQAITIIWYAQHGHTPDTAAQRRAAAWYRSKTTPSFLDMIVKLRRVLIAAKFRASGGDEPTREEIQAICQAWAEVEAA